MNIRTLRWCTTAGPVILQWPQEITPDDAADALDAVRLACRAIERVAAQRPSFEGYEDALRIALEPPQ